MYHGRIIAKPPPYVCRLVIGATWSILVLDVADYIVSVTEYE